MLPAIASRGRTRSPPCDAPDLPIRATFTAEEVSANADLEAELSERRRAEAALEKLATSDVLTGLANRSLFHGRLDQALKRAIRHRGNVALLFVDLDKFKQINDVQGHGVGDRILRKSRSGCARRYARQTPLPGSAAMSSPSCSRTWRGAMRSQALRKSSSN